MQNIAVLEMVSGALELAIFLSVPFVVVALIVGFLAGLFQAGTSIQDHSISTVPRLTAVGLAVLFLGPWVLRSLVAFAQALLGDFSAAVG